MFGKKKDKPFNPYENHIDELIHKVWESATAFMKRQGKLLRA